MARTSGTRNPDKITTEKLTELERVAKSMGSAERVLARALLVNLVAVDEERAAEPRSRAAKAKRRLVDAVLSADLACRKANGHGLRPERLTADYKDHRPEGAPTLQWIYRNFGPPARVFAEVGLMAQGHPQARLMISYAPGRNGRVAKGEGRYSDAEKDRAAASVVEELGGLKPSVDQHEDVRQRVGGPNYMALRTRTTGKLSWDEVYERALVYCAARPDVYPRTATYLAWRDETTAAA